MTSLDPLKIDTISSNTLFHFTNSASSLISILTDEFCPHYCLEDYSLLTGARSNDFQLAFPMICFCDLPLSQIKTHLNFYGNYGIGMTKEWGKEKGLSPILYSYEGSLFQNHITTVLEESSEEIEKKSGFQLKHMNRFIGFLRYIKPYEGQFWRKDHYIPNVRFYDEREWRYIPETLPTDTEKLINGNYDGINDFLEIEDFLNPILLAENNAKINKKIFKLTFEPKNIKYIIVDSENERLPIIKSLRRIKDKYLPDDVEKLISRVITADQIKEDF